MFDYNTVAVTGSASGTRPRATLTGAASQGTGGGMGPGSASGAGGNFGSGGTYLGGIDLSFPLLQDILNTNDTITLDNTYREIYLMDAVSGPVVDMMSMLPWSDYSILGVSDPKIKALYESSLEELSIQRLMKLFLTSNMVLGRGVGSLVFDKSRGIFTDCILYNASEAEIIPIPFIGYDPKINIKLSKEFKKWLNSTDTRDIEARKELPPEDIKLMLGSGKIELEPLKTIYVTRTHLPGSEGVSVFSRILPIWLLEKCLLRGTILASTRRQKSILHITMGSDDVDYDLSQYQSVAELFANADRDPLGAAVVTRPDVTVSEVKSPTDLWSHSSESDGFTQAKLRALGVSDSFLSGDATYSNQENTIGLMLENLRDQRQELTRAIIRDKIFLSLAKYHNFRERTQAERDHKIQYDVKSNKAKRNAFLYKFAQLTGSRNMAEISTYVIPDLKWTKDLTPTGSSSELSLMKELKDSGIPLPAAMLATAAGADIDTIVSSYEDDLKVREKMADYLKKVKKLMPADEEGEGDDPFQLNSSDKVNAEVEPISLKGTASVNALASAVLGKSVELKPSQLNYIMNYLKSVTKRR